MRLVNPNKSVEFRLKAKVETPAEQCHFVIFFYNKQAVRSFALYLAMTDDQWKKSSLYATKYKEKGRKLWSVGFFT